jgi:hypothetical protein
MSDENNNDGGEGKDSTSIPNERFQNFQKEMDRKLSNTNKQIEALLQSQNQLLQQFAPKKQEESSEVDSVGQLLYSDPDKALKLHAKKVKEETIKEVTQTMEQQAKTQQVIQGLVSEYPDLQDLSTPLAKKTLEIYESLPDSDKNSSMSYKLAVKEAAESLDILPKSKRKQDNDDFSLSSGGYNRGEKGAPRLDPRSIEFAKAMGVNIEDKEVAKRVAGYAKRDFSRYGG